MITLSILLLAFLQAAKESPDAYASLRLYQGQWAVTMSTNPPRKPPTRLENACGLIGTVFGCQQTVDGKTGALVLFLPGKPGRYVTQSVMPDGSAGGRGELTIQGNRWTFLGREKENGTEVMHRTINVFTGNDRIHFQVASSTDGKNWKVSLSGDETRATPAGVAGKP